MAQPAYPLLSAPPRSGASAAAEPAVEPTRRKRRSRGTRRLLMWCAIALVVIGVAVMAPALSPRDPLSVVPALRLKPPGTHFPDGSIAWLGTDGVGRDILSRLLVGTRLSLLIAGGSVILAALIGIVLGLLSGFYGRTLDDIIMRVTDIQLAFPSILLAMALTAAIGPSVLSLILALGVSRWTQFARLVRGDVLNLRDREYVQAARATGASQLRVMFRHILPNVIGGAIILAALTIGQLIIAESSLSFLGLGIQPPTPSWGGMIGDARNYLDVAWWASTFPGLAIAFTVVVMGSLGDALRDVLDPRFKGV